MIDIKTGKHFNAPPCELSPISTGGKEAAVHTFTRRSALKGLAAILAAGVAPSLCGSITRGIGYRNLAGRMAAMCSKDEMPGFTRVNYLQTNGLAYILNPFGTNVSTGLNYEFEIDFQMLSTEGKIYIGEGFTSGGCNAFVALNINSSYGLYFCFSNTTSGSRMPIGLQNKNDRHKVRAVCVDGNLEYYFDCEKIVSTTGLSYTIHGFCILGIHDNTYRVSGIQRNYGERVVLDGVQYLDIVPAIRKSDGRPCMYNRVNNQPLFSSTSTDFTYG